MFELTDQQTPPTPVNKCPISAVLGSPTSNFFSLAAVHTTLHEIDHFHAHTHIPLGRYLQFKGNQSLSFKGLNLHKYSH